MKFSVWIIGFIFMLFGLGNIMHILEFNNPYGTSLFLTLLYCFTILFVDKENVQKHGGNKE